MSENNSPGHEGPDHQLEPRAIRPDDAAPLTDAEDESSHRSSLTQSVAPAQLASEGPPTHPLFATDGAPAAVYARNAVVQQDQSSLEAQVEGCVRQAAEDGLPAVAAAHVFRDQGSGIQLDHPGLNQLRRAVQAGEVGVVYVDSPDRLSRSLAHLVLLCAEFAAAGVEIRLVWRSLDNDLLDRLSGLVASGGDGCTSGKAEMPTTSDDR